MKQKIIIIGIILATFNIAQGQSSNGIGFKAGLNRTTYHKIGKAEPVNNIHFGVVGEIALAKKFSLQPELLYSKAGAKYRANITWQQIGIVEEQLTYIHIPIMAKYYVFKGLSIQAGPQFGVGLAWKSISEIDTDTFDPPPFEIALGAGIEYKLKNGLFIQARRVRGRTNVIDNYKNSMWTFSAGWLFNQSKKKTKKE